MLHPRTLLALAGLVLAGCSTEEAETSPVPTGALVVDLTAPGTMEHCWSGGVDLSDPLQQGLALDGWHLDETQRRTGQGVWSSSAEPGLFLPLAKAPARASTLSLLLSVPEFHKVNFELALSVNGVDLGNRTLPAGRSTIEYPLDQGMLTAGLNLVEFKTTAPISPAERGVGRDKRELGFSLVGLMLQADGLALLEPMAHRRWVVQPGAELTWKASDVGARLLVQDATDGTSLADRELAPPHGSLALADPGREVLLTLVPATRGGVSPLDELMVRTEPGYTDLIVIVVDTLRADAIGPAPTPNLDALAAESVVFDACFAHAPITLPSHTSLFSSRLPHESGVVNNGQNVPRDLPLLSETLGLHGYRPLAAVSLGTLWFEGRGRGAGLSRGFQHYRAAGAYDSYAEMTRPVVSELLTGVAEQQPLFLFAHYADPHEPYRSQFDTEQRAQVALDGELLLGYDPASAPYLEQSLQLPAGRYRLEFTSPGVETQLRLLQLRGEDERFVPFDVVEGALMQPSERQVVEFELEADETLDLFAWTSDHPRAGDRLVRYAEEVHHVDKAIGDLVEQLKAAGRWQQSLVVFTSDHGEGLGQHGLVGHVDGLWDEQLHVPLYVKLPAGPAWQPLEARLDAVRQRLVRHTDLAPTLLELLGLPPLEGATGLSLLDPELVDGPSRAVLAQTHAPEARADVYALRDERLKLIYHADARRFQLFDLEADPGETEDVFAERADEVAAWQVELRDLARLWQRDGSVDLDAEVRERLEALGY